MMVHDDAIRLVLVKMCVLLMPQKYFKIITYDHNLERRRDDEAKPHVHEGPVQQRMMPRKIAELFNSV